MDVPGRLRGDAHTRRGDRENRAAARKIQSGKRQPAEGRVHEVGAGRADDEFIVGGDLADPQRKTVGQPILLNPQGKESGRGDGFDISGREPAADEICR